MVPALANACVRFLEQSLTARNACLLLSQARLFSEPALIQRAWEVIDAQAEMALTSEAFADIDFDTLMSILSRETLNCKETVVFAAANSWAQADCKKKDLDPCEPDNRKSVLGKAIYKIRFPAMSIADFADVVAMSGMLTIQETNDIFLYFTAKEKPPLDYDSKARRGLSTQFCPRFVCFLTSLPFPLLFGLNSIFYLDFFPLSNYITMMQNDTILSNYITMTRSCQIYLFSIWDFIYLFYLDFYTPSLFGLLYPFSVLTFIFLFYWFYWFLFLFWILFYFLLSLIFDFF